MILNDYSDLQRVKEENPDKKIVYVSGSFDLVHAGHVLFFEDCKSLGDILVAAVAEDSVIKSLKGDERPVMNQYVRIKMLDSLKPIDYCFMNKCPGFEELDVIFENLRPDVYAVNQDGHDLKDREEYTERHGVEIRILDRTCPPEFEGISTSKLIEKIKRL